MRCFLCRAYYHGAIVCLDCNSPYCSFECLHADDVHQHQCKILQAPVKCVFCLNTVKYVAEGFTNPCGHGIHASCSLMSQHYGLEGCPACPSADALEQMGRLMMLEYARFCFTAIRADVPVPELPTTLVRFFAAETRSEKPHARALMYMYGTTFANGLGVAANEEKAYYWLSRAAAFGHGHAMYAVSETSEKKLRIAARLGSPHACVELATMTADTTWLEKALKLAPFDLETRKLLAAHYETEEPSKALRHHFMMARQGHSASLERLARLYYDMTVTDPKFLIPSAWWASRALPSPSVFKTQALIALRLGYDERALHCMQKAAVGSCPASTDALYELARFYEQGVGTSRDADQAERLLERAAAAGQPSAQFDLAMKRWETSEAMSLVRAAAKTHLVAMHFLSRYDTRRELLEAAGTRIPAALYDLAVRHARAAEIQDTATNYRAAADLLERALAMPAPTFDCAALDVEKTKSFLAHLHKRLGICASLQTASMDTILRLAQFTGTAVLVDIAECSLSM